MRYFFMLLIRIYWLIPKHKRRACIFKESCSRYMYRVLKTGGLQTGIKAYLERKAQCRPGYYFLDDQHIRLADKSIIALNELVKERL